MTDLIGWFGRRGIYYGWIIVAVMFVTLFVSLGFRFAFGVYYSAILDETGWGRAETAGVVSSAMIVYACTAARSGYLFDRFGTDNGVIIAVGLGVILACFGLWGATRRRTVNGKTH